MNGHYRNVLEALLLLWLMSSAGCGAGGGSASGVCDPLVPDCSNGLVCDVVVAAEARCVMPVLMRGSVVDLSGGDPIADARVQAVDINGAAAGTSGVTDADGTFTLIVPAVRNVDGIPVEGIYTLRVQAAGFQEFPTAIRPALPLDAATAEATESGWILESALTTVGLVALPGDTSDLGTISGLVKAESNAGILVIAENETGALTGFSDSEGNYTIFNVPPGSYTVQGYAAGVQLDPEATQVIPAQDATGVDLSESARPLSTVTGNVQIVNAPGDSQTSVVLAVESTFVEAAGRGVVPPGLRAGEVTGAFVIENVPDGRYVVLAAFENDSLVRDPDQTIGGTAIVRIELPDADTGNVLDLAEGFKVTGALGVIAPGADGPEQVFTTTPTFEWEDDSSEDGYQVRVFDAFGNEVWSDEIGPVSGSPTVTHDYAGPTLESGMVYQFRTTSFRDKSGQRTAISVTEDLKGVFFYVNP